MSEITIRSATDVDLSLVHPLIERAYRGESARPGWTHEADLLDNTRTTLEELETLIADPRQRLLVAWRDDMPIGCVAVSDRGEGLAYLGQLCVEPELQAGGLGRLLIFAAEECAIEIFGAERTEMTVIDRRAELIAYYERRGYVATGERRDFPVLVDPPLFMAVLEKPLVALVEG